jgi:hypothetical protein
MTTAPLCSAYDQISDRKCRYYEGHNGRHNFARLDHDASLERELRRELDEMTAARDEACGIAAKFALLPSWPEAERVSRRVAGLRKVGS